MKIISFKILSLPRSLYIFGSIVLWSFFSACEDRDVNIPEGSLEEHMVDIQGQWRVNRVLLNGLEITDRMDFSEVLLTLQMNNGPTTYEIETGQAPFPVLTGGTWSYDDLVYPTSIRLQNNDRQESLLFASPPISGDLQFSLSFSLGCSDNIYTYAFRKI